jgi:predicted nucleic acid-binding protein
MYLFDTDILSNIVKPQPSAYLMKKLEDLPKRLQYTTSISIGEIYYGVYRAPHKKRILDFYKKIIFPNINILFFDDVSAEIYGKTKAYLSKKGIGCSEPDLRIASIALRNKLTLVTGNTRHFKSIPNLDVENWIR